MKSFMCKGSKRKEIAVLAVVTAIGIPIWMFVVYCVMKALLWIANN